MRDIPVHWDVKRLKYLANVVFSNVDKHSHEDELPVRLCNYVDVYYHDHIDSSIDFMDATATEVELRKFQLQVNDVLVTKDSEAADDIAVPSVVAEALPGVLCGYHLAQVRPFARRIDGRFLARSFEAVGPKAQFEAESTGVTRYGLGKYAIDNGLFGVPPLQEQEAISAFLDHETKRIDDLIAKKKKQVELLREKRIGLITEAITKGIDPSAKLKPSGIEWLGDIPEHWNAKRLKFLIAEPLKYGANEAADEDDPSQPRYVRITDIDADGGLREETFRSLPEEVAQPYLLKEGDVLLARSGATVGKSFYYTPEWGRAAFAGYMIRARFDVQQHVPKFMHYVTQSYYYWEWISTVNIQATIQNVSAEKYADLWIAVPSLDEQTAIVEHLNEETMRIDEIVTLIDRSISLLTEYRLAVISSAVTGKLSVKLGS
ncbi:MAG: restriction endonuclease subunit S [Planctomycetes bacterium]|nr:restriction endonuclease subunit S [Planctomycetota bacterium]